jgi:xylulose-5-phosphate/fructose-6-phosphate phosphoketolase
LKALKLPSLGKYEIKVKGRGGAAASSMIQGGKMLRDIFKLNKKNFRMFCPDELESNKLSEIFKATKRAYTWPIPKNAENTAYDGRAMEMLSEHTLQGWMQGYLLTGRHGMLVSYEAFTTIITSMVDQYAKFLKQAMKVKWRKPVSSAVYLESSVGWRQDHNGYSHQNPSFVSNVLQKHGDFCQIYYPADANGMIAALEEVYKRKDSIVVIVAGKRELPQWQSLKEARAQAKEGIGVWEWVGGKAASRKPDVVLASAGDYITQEALYAVKLCREIVPELKIRYVNVSELTSMCLGDNYSKGCVNENGVTKYFTKDKPVVFSYHGYVNDVEAILWPHATSDRFSLHGYHEEGSTTTPFDLKISNGVSFYHLAIDMIEQGAKSNKKVAGKKASAIAKLRKMIATHQKYIAKYGDDPASIKDLKW